MRKNTRVYGIDLGTGNSAIAVYNPVSKAAQIITNKDARTTLPSAVYIPNNNQAVVGQEALNRLGGPDAKNVVVWSKRQIAQDKMFTSDGKFLGDYPTYEGSPLTPVTAAALILKILTEQIPDHKKEDGPIHVVVTFPAHFSPSARERTRQACKVAGVDVIGMVEEPIAAALQYSAGESRSNCTLLVYDWGCGTFDSTLLSFDAKGHGKVIAKAGDPMLGGADCDNRFAYEISQLYRAQKKLKVELTKEDFIRDHLDSIDKTRLVHKFRKLANEAKHALSSLTETEVVVDDGDVIIPVTRSMFEKCIAEFVKETHAIVKTVLDEAEEKDSRVDEVILVGGSSLIPCVKTQLETAFPGLTGKIKLCDPMECVAKGAAIWAHMLAENGIDGENVTAINIPGRIENTASFSLGVKCVRNSSGGGIEHYVSNVILKGQSLPAVAKDTFSTFYADQENVAINIHSSELQDRQISIADSTEIANPESNLLPFEKKVPKDTPIEIEIHLDEAGLITVTGKSLVDSGYCHFQLHLTGSLDAKGIAAATKQIENGNAR